MYVLPDWVAFAVLVALLPLADKVNVASLDDKVLVDRPLGFACDITPVEVLILKPLPDCIE